MKMESWLDEYVHIRTWNVVKGQKRAGSQEASFAANTFSYIHKEVWNISFLQNLTRCLSFRILFVFFVIFSLTGSYGNLTYG